jgi:RimJ/RimL family protein N-acetyltransferase
MSEILAELERIETPRLRLRRLSATDAAALFSIFSDPDVTRYLLSPAMTEMAEAEASIRRKLEYYEGSEVFALGVESKANRSLLGTFTLFNLALQSKRAELGFVLGKQNWGQDFMFEATGALIETAFTKLGFNRLEADIDPRNDASAKLLERLGFKREGFLREREVACGEVTDTALYGLLKREWDRQAFAARLDRFA